MGGRRTRLAATDLVPDTGCSLRSLSTFGRDWISLSYISKLHLEKDEKWERVWPGSV
jgi:hypothetical protein